MGRQSGIASRPGYRSVPAGTALRKGYLLELVDKRVVCEGRQASGALQAPRPGSGQGPCSYDCCLMGSDRMSTGPAGSWGWGLWRATPHQGESFPLTPWIRDPRSIARHRSEDLKGPRALPRSAHNPSTSGSCALRKAFRPGSLCFRSPALPLPHKWDTIFFRR